MEHAVRAPRRRHVALVTAVLACMLEGTTARAEDQEAPGASWDGQRLHVGVFGSGYFVAGQWTDWRTGYLGHGGGVGLEAGFRPKWWVSFDLKWRFTLNQEDFAAARVTYFEVDRLYVTTVGGGPTFHWPFAPQWDAYSYVQLAYAVVGTSYQDCPECDSIFTRGWTGEVGVGLDFHLPSSISLGARVGAQVSRFRWDAFERRFRTDVEQARETLVLPVIIDLTVRYRF
jgi:hypothetical protein